MSALAAPLLIVVAALQSSAADSMRALAAHLPTSALVQEARARPLAVREAVGGAFGRAVRAPVDDSALVIAGRLGAAYAAAWQDSFLVQEVARFTARSHETRLARVWIDSVRLAGFRTYGRDGALAAVTVWRRALARALVIADTTAIAAVTGNIGAGFEQAGRLDSAVKYLKWARTRAAAIGDVPVEGNAVDELAGLSEDQGDMPKAREQYVQALALHRRIGDTRGEAADRNNLGLLAQSAGDLDEARQQFDTALALNRRDGREETAATNLFNLAGLASLAGDFAGADSLYRDALAVWRAREMWADAADALHGLGQLALRRGDYPAAQAALREALAIYDRTGPVADALTVRRELAGALGAAGELQGALDELRRAERLADSAGAAPGIRAGLALARADLDVQLNALGEAERRYAGAAALYREASDLGGEAAALEGQGALLLARDDYVQAETFLQAALRTQQATGQQRAAALTRVSLGLVARGRGDTAMAERQFARAAKALDHVGDPVGAAAALGEQASLAMAERLPAAADSLYRAGLGRLEGRVVPEVAWRLHFGLALVLRARGAPERALRELRAAVAEIERPGKSLILPERRTEFLADKWDVYAQVAFTERALGRPDAAFDASERLRAREMLALLAEGRVTAPADTAVDLLNQEQDLRRRIVELTRALEGPPGGAESVRGPQLSSAGGAREALLHAQDAYVDLLREMQERAPRQAALVARPSATWHDVAERLVPHEAFIEYLLSDSGSVAFVITRDTLHTVDLGIGRRELAHLVDFARGTIEPKGSPGTDSLWRGPLRRLYQYLVRPIEDARLLSGITSLVLVPHAELHYLPFAALIDGEGSGEFLVERYQVAVTPSASVWLALGDRRMTRATSGILALAPRPDALPASLQEVAAIQQVFGAGARVLTGSAANEAVFRTEAPLRRVLHLATYGVLNKQNPLFSYVELAPSGAEDGHLYVHDVFGLDLAADLVVLSACQTGLASGAFADVPSGDDWVGLTRAFLHAGAARVMASLWPVDDRATAELMGRFYDHFKAGADPAEALAQAQRALLAVPATRSPFYWAAFVVTESGAARTAGAGGVGR